MGRPSTDRIIRLLGDALEGHGYTGYPVRALAQAYKDQEPAHFKAWTAQRKRTVSQANKHKDALSYATSELSSLLLNTPAFFTTVGKFPTRQYYTLTEVGWDRYDEFNHTLFQTAHYAPERGQAVQKSQRYQRRGRQRSRHAEAHQAYLYAKLANEHHNYADRHSLAYDIDRVEWHYRSSGGRVLDAIVESKLIYEWQYRDQKRWRKQRSFLDWQSRIAKVPVMLEVLDPKTTKDWTELTPADFDQFVYYVDFFGYKGGLYKQAMRKVPWLEEVKDLGFKLSGNRWVQLIDHLKEWTDAPLIPPRQGG